MQDRCTNCGRFVNPVGEGVTYREITPDSAYTWEEWEVLCQRCNGPSKRSAEVMDEALIIYSKTLKRLAER